MALAEGSGPAVIHLAQVTYPRPI